MLKYIYAQVLFFFASLGLLDMQLSGQFRYLSLAVHKLFLVFFQVLVMPCSYFPLSLDLRPYISLQVADNNFVLFQLAFQSINLAILFSKKPVMLRQYISHLCRMLLILIFKLIYSLLDTLILR
jgi:hypothetical protein